MLKTLQWTLQIVFLVFSTIIVVKSQSTVNKLRGVYSWKALEFAFPNNQARENAILIGDFIPGNPVPIDVDVDYGGNYGPVIFVAIPRFQKGVPMTLGYVTDALSEENNPVIAPYPDWSWNTLENCEGIISVYRVQIDDCRRIWILDTGVMGEHRKCPPQILSFSLDTNKLLSRYRFPKGQYKEDSLFVTPAIDVRPLNGKCRDTFVYIADVTSFALIVYDHRQQRSWKIYNKLFYPYPMHGTFHIKNETFDLMDGILGLALGPLTSDGDRILYFHSLASRIESRVSTSVIRNFSLFHENAEAVPRAFKPFKMERSSQSAAEAMDRNGVLFYGLMSDLAIGCWNSRDYPEFGGLNMETVAVDDDTLQFPSGVKVVTNESGRQELWVLTSSFQRYMSGSLHPNETNFRIQAAYIDELQISPRVFLRTPTLEALNLNDNQLRQILNFETLRNLKKLYLMNSAISALDTTTSFKKIRNLKLIAFSSRIGIQFYKVITTYSNKIGTYDISNKPRYELLKYLPPNMALIVQP